MKVLTAVRPARYRVFVLDVVLPVPRFQPLIFGEEAAGFISKRSWFLVPEKTATVLRASKSGYKYRFQR
jgi:hypothetical protein